MNREEKTLEQCQKKVPAWPVSAPPDSRCFLEGPNGQLPKAFSASEGYCAHGGLSPLILSSDQQATAIESGVFFFSLEKPKERGRGAKDPGRRVIHCLDECSKLFLFPSIQLRFDNGSWDERYGASGGNPVTVILNKEEKIIGISGTNGAYIYQIIIITDQPREMMLGNRRGTSDYTDYPIDPSHMFKGICAFYVPGGLRGIRFLWGDANSTCAQ